MYSIFYVQCLLPDYIENKQQNMILHLKVMRNEELSMLYAAAAAAAAKSRQSCPTLCDPIDSSPPGSAVPGILQLSQFSSVTQSCPTLCDPMNHSTPGLPVHHQLPEFTQTHVHRVRDAIQPSHPLSSPSLPPIPPSIRVFSIESTLSMRWPKYWSFSFSIIPSKEIPTL